MQTYKWSLGWSAWALRFSDEGICWSILKKSKKGTKTISEFVLQIRAIKDSLMAIGNTISECDQIDSILQGLPKDYNHFIIMVYGKTDQVDIYEVEGLLCVQEA